LSEYQYLEFRAIDRPLTKKALAELRSYSTGAKITPTTFVNEYSWGNFKGDADLWMPKYLDAFYGSAAPQRLSHSVEKPDSRNRLRM
jgi:hypothetical protein